MRAKSRITCLAEGNGEVMPELTGAACSGRGPTAAVLPLPPAMLACFDVGGVCDYYEPTVVGGLDVPATFNQ